MQHLRMFSASTSCNRVLGLLAILSVLTLGLVEQSYANDDPNKIHACKHKVGGDLRIVETATDCLNSEEPTSWGIQGPAGTARAFAHVSDGSLDNARSQNISSMTTVISGGLAFQCFDLPFVPFNLVVTGELIQNSFGFSFPFASGTVIGTSVMSAVPCPAGTKAVVVQQANLAGNGFFVVFN